jgi:hypothetical protein
MTESAAIADSAIQDNLKKPNQVWFKYSEPVSVSYSGTFPGFFLHGPGIGSHLLVPLLGVV